LPRLRLAPGPGEVQVDALEERLLDAQLPRVRAHPAEGRLGALLHHVAQLAGEGEALLAEHLRGLDVEHLAAGGRPREARRDAGGRSPRVVALEWLDPPFTAGHWVPEQIRQAGGWELLGDAGEPSRQTTWDAVAEVDPEMLLLLPCGFHLKETLHEWSRTRRPPGWADFTAVRRGHVFALDGSAYFSRPGPRVIDGIELLAEIFDPDAFVDVAPFGSWTPVED